MKTQGITLSIIIALFILGCSQKPAEHTQAVNAIIGDRSFVSEFGVYPDAKTDEDLRLQTHLKYVEQLLRDKDVSELPEELRRSRLEMLDLLHNYWVRGIFPRNYDYEEGRRPCFIDKHGRICAVGYLIEETAGREAAELINHSYQDEYLLAMDDGIVDGWVSASGLTKEECAMIQPQYQYWQAEPEIPGSYRLSSALLGGANVSLMTINAVQIARGTNDRAASVLGLLSGAGQIVLGVANHGKTYDSNNGHPQTNVPVRNLSLVNIGLGTSTMILSGVNLFSNKATRYKAVTWDVYSFPTPNNQVGVGLSLTKNL